ncbi:SDR family NAD(P)-dependent oxidoreductase [Paracoccus solventivorans]|nr:SDR family oxidoreductase [Paracoccus solventivorans]
MMTEADDGRHPAFALRGSNAVIGGGTSGVGLETARLLLREGAAQVVLIGRNPHKGAAAVAQLNGEGHAGVSSFQPAELCDPGAVAPAIAAIEARIGPIDIAISAANSGAVPRLFHLLDPGEIPAQLNEQALPALLLSAAVLPGMRERRRGAIILVASDAARVPTPGEAVIGAGMAAITRFATTLAMEAKRDGIRVNAVTPSLIADTQSYDRIMDDPFAAKLFQRAEKAAALGLTRPEDIAPTLVFLASPAAARLTGQVISVNGGISAA